MTQFELPYFGKIDIENITEEQEYMKINFQDRQLVLMWFVEESIDEDYYQMVKTILEDLQKFDEDNHHFLQEEFKNQKNSTILEYLKFHLDEIPPEAFTGITDKNSTRSENLEKLFNVLNLYNISFHDDDIVADYVLDPDISDYRLAIYINKEGKKKLAWES